MFNFAFQDGNNDRFGLFACFDNARLPACLVFSIRPDLGLSGCNRLLGRLRHALLILLVQIFSDTASDKVPGCYSEGGADYLVIFTSDFIANDPACYYT
ncbi:hypothetical protein D9M71_603390 [compost metagenome]